MRDFDIRGIEFDLLAAEARHADRLALRRAVLDGEAYHSRRILPWLKSLGYRFSSRH